MKRKRGDRKDAVLLRKEDSLHFVMGVLYPQRTDNEAFLSEDFDLTKVLSYLEEKKNRDPEYRYNVFQFIVTAVLRAIQLRPKMNRFYVNGNYYQRNEISACFIIKKKFEDRSEEGMAFVTSKPEWTIDDVHDDLKRQILSVKKGNSTDTDDTMELLQKMPRFIGKTALRFLMFMDRHGWLPDSLVKQDPNHVTVFFSNLGSIKLKAGYHHLSNWGTNSIFCTVGAYGKKTVHDEN